ncbi:tetratricopeptide repeat protein [Microbacterium karelineae]|uniref:tetratricopeptide repeat protein n=1 Tax=Microbacterium karelineae TaxID=2654283 RepID=UPI0012E9C678|nr:tetratricopeptide repeat protein [Microbacterium karelineae]
MKTLDDIARQLREWRIRAGSPSYADLARRVGELRGGRPGATWQGAPGRVTVYDCFREGRTRIDVELASDIAEALGITGVELDAWRMRCADALRPRSAESAGRGAAGLVTATSATLRPAEPGIGSLDAHGADGVLFAGIGGSGKTQAALRALDRARVAGEIDGVVMLHIDGPGASFDSVLQAAAHELGVGVPEGDGAAARILDVLARRRRGLLVDDVTDGAQVAPFGSAERAVPFVATSRAALDVPGMTRVDVPPWTPGEVRGYFARAVDPSCLAADPPAADALIALMGGLPLVVALVAARVRSAAGWSLADHVDALRERREGGRLEDAVRASIDATWRGLTGEARTLLKTLAAGPRAGLSDSAVRAVVDIDTPAAVRDLTRAFLLTRTGGRYHLHDVARAFARDRAREEDPPSARIALEDRLLDRICAEAWGIALALGRSDHEGRRASRAEATVPDPSGWLATDLPGALELARGAAARRPSAVIELSEALTTSLERARLPGLAEKLQRTARDAAMRIDDHVGVARARTALAVTAMRAGQEGEAVDALAEVAERAGDSWTISRVRNLAGILACRTGDLATGEAHFHAARELAERDGYDALTTAIAGNIAIARAYSGELEQSLAWDERALEGALRSGNRGLAATTLSNMCEAQRMLGRYGDAIASARRAIDFAESAGDRLALTHALANLGLALTLAGDNDEAVACLERATVTAADAGYREIEATLHNNIAEAHLKAGRTHEAGIAFARARIAPNDGPFEPARALHGLGRLAAEANPERARTLFAEALSALGDASEPLAAEIREAAASVTP